MLSQVGIALGIAGATLFQQWRNAEQLAVLNLRFTSGDPELTQLLDQLTNVFRASQGSMAGQVAFNQLTKSMSQQAAMLASLEYFHVLAILSVVMAVVMHFQRTIVLLKR